MGGTFNFSEPIVKMTALAPLPVHPRSLIFPITRSPNPKTPPSLFPLHSFSSRNPFLLDSWTKYLEFRKTAKPRVRYIIYERALKCLPRSYKLWRAYLQERSAELKDKPVTDKRYTVLINAYERSLVHLHKMPRIWLDYGELLMALRRGTLTRRTLDRALQALPVTQVGARVGRARQRGGGG